MSLLEKLEYKSWQENYNWGFCKLDLKNTADFLGNFLVEEKDGYVLSLNGAWGTGKTEFLKRFYVHMAMQGYPVIYINAWESDFTNSPLEVIASELMRQLSPLLDKNPEGLEKLKSMLGGFFKGASIIAAAAIARKVGFDSSDAKDGLKYILDLPAIDLMNHVSKDYTNKVNTLKQIKSALTELSNDLEGLSAKSPIFILIDELDRCRPDYAVEFLEVIKHFFEAKGIVFVIANDTQQLEASIKVLYGNQFDSRTYLRRFFTRVANLPSPNLDKYLQTSNCDFFHYDNIDFDFISKEIGAKKIVSLSSEYFSLRLRDVETVISKVHGVLRSIDKNAKVRKKRVYLSLVILVFLLTEHHVNADSYARRDGLINENWNSVLKGEVISSAVAYEGVTFSKLVSISSFFCSFGLRRAESSYGGSIEIAIWPDHNVRNTYFRTPPIPTIDVNRFSFPPLGPDSINLNSANLSLFVRDGFEIWFVPTYKQYIELSSMLT